MTTLSVIVDEATFARLAETFADAAALRLGSPGTAPAVAPESAETDPAATAPSGQQNVVIVNAKN